MGEKKRWWGGGSNFKYTVIKKLKSLREVKELATMLFMAIYGKYRPSKGNRVDLG